MFVGALGLCWRSNISGPILTSQGASHLPAEHPSSNWQRRYIRDNTLICLLGDVQAPGPALNVVKRIISDLSTTF